MNDESDNSITGRMAFMNDRFYLDASPYLENCAVQPEEAADYARRFSRSQYLQQIHNSDENIQCVLMSTYRLDWEYLQEEFPHLFDKNLAIPCLVLHGEKREEEKQWWSRYDPLNSEIDEDDSSYTHLHECIIPNMEGETISSDGSGHVPRDGNVGNGNPNMEIREVIPQFNFPDDASSDHLSAGISRNVAGVHHPKYMLVFPVIACLWLSSLQILPRKVVVVAVGCNISLVVRRKIKMKPVPRMNRAQVLVLYYKILSTK